MCLTGRSGPMLLPATESRAPLWASTHLPPPSAAGRAARLCSGGPAHLLRHPGAALQLRQPLPGRALAWRATDGRRAGAAWGLVQGRWQGAEQALPCQGWQLGSSLFSSIQLPSKSAPIHRPVQAPSRQRRCASPLRRRPWLHSRQLSSCWRTPPAFQPRCCAVRRPTF